MDSLITLHTNQIINKDVRISEMNMFNDIDVENFVNGVDVQLEYSNTLSVRFIIIIIIINNILFTFIERYKTNCFQSNNI